jgi:hypothetical protein
MLKRMHYLRGAEMKKIVLVVALLLLMDHGCATYTGTPRHALSQLREAILNHDPDTALTYIDLDRVVENMVETGLRGHEATSDTQSLGLAAAKKAAPFMLPLVKELVRRQLRLAITASEETGYFSSIRKASVWYLDIVVEGDTATVTPKGGKKALFRMGKTTAGAWKIVEIMPEAGSEATGVERGQLP